MQRRLEVVKARQLYFSVTSEFSILSQANPTNRCLPGEKHSGA
jgi:hypothetical protein